jgi:exodeoxyribonuclease V gamma subunit
VLHVHRAERTARLVDGLAAVLGTPLADPFASEVVAVPAKGVERWLAQRLSTVLGAGSAGDGICSGIVFPSAGRLVDEALAAARGADPRDDPWADPVWPLLEVVDEHLGEPWCRVLAHHLGYGADDHRRGRRWSAAARLAGLFRSYGAHRPQMLRDWADGRDTDGHEPLPADLTWQAELWRRLRDRLGPSPAERLEVECAALRADPRLSDLPERISIFGPTRLHADALAVLSALAEHRAVHLWLPHPSPVV